MITSRLLPFLLGLALPAFAGATGAQVTTPQVRAELVAHAPEGLSAGKPVWLGLLIEHQPHWHTYWKNPGDSGLPTTMQWQLPHGAAAGEIRWPTPAKLPIGPLMNFGYEGRLLLPVQLSLPADFHAAQLEVKLHAEWLVCKDVCIPESGDFSLSVPARAATAAHAALFDAAAKAAPVLLASAKATASVENQQLVLKATGLPAEWQGRKLAFFPEVAGVIQNAAPIVTEWKGGQWQAQVPLDPQRSESPKLIPAVLTAEGQTVGIGVEVAMAGPWPAVAVAATPAAPALGNAVVSSPTAPATGFALSVLLALLGGALLNLMPCVFPILSLKLFGFAAHAHDRRQLLAGGLAYTVGVVLSFVALAALLLALRAGGEQLGWGFQLQSPVFVAALAALFSVIGLNLAGVFEFGNVLPSRWVAARARHPLVDSFLTGVLAVAVASPCTAPFMGASLGAAVTLPTAEALAVFAALGLGMAMPYLLASTWPRLARLMPKPGVWMAHFKTLMAFPMFATVVWLVWVLGQQAGIDAVAALLGTLVAVAFTAWTLGSAELGMKARAVLGTAAVLMLGAALVWTLPALRTAEAATPAAPGAWLPWSPEKVAELTAQGRPVFVDFTAAWCVTCQYNKRTTLANETVKAKFESRQVALLRADWTRRDAAITAELTRLGRSGVPVYALYAPGGAGPRLLSEILSVDEVTGAVAALP